LIAVLFVLALIRTGLAGTLVFLALVGFGGWAAWSWMDYERLMERRALETRRASLEAQALIPHSPLACLDGAGGDTIEAACERDVFATPESAAAAVSYTSARLALLNDALGYAVRREPGFENTLDGVRTALEQDRFGLVAHVLSRRNCTADRCEPFRLFRDAERVRRNMRDATFDTHLARAAPAWNARPAMRASTSDNTSTATSTPAPPARGAPLPPNYTLPSSSSIPPVSIMSPEPPASAPAAAAEPPAQAATPTPPRRPAQQQQRPQRPAQQQQQPRRPPSDDTANPRGGLPAPPTRIQ
jgi:hypothetical protein